MGRKSKAHYRDIRERSYSSRKQRRHALTPQIKSLCPILGKYTLSQERPLHCVFLMIDDFTPMEFVVQVLASSIWMPRLQRARCFASITWAASVGGPFRFGDVAYWPCAPKARITSGGRFHPDSCRLVR